MGENARDVVRAFDQVLGPLPPPTPHDELVEIRQRRAGDADIDTLLAHIDSLHARFERVNLVLGGVLLDDDEEQGRGG